VSPNRASLEFPAVTDKRSAGCGSGLYRLAKAGLAPPPAYFGTTAISRNFPLDKIIYIHQCSQVEMKKVHSKAFDFQVDNLRILKYYHRSPGDCV
jgi:hypothetical protein